MVVAEPAAVVAEAKVDVPHNEYEGFTMEEIGAIRDQDGDNDHVYHQYPGVDVGHPVPPEYERMKQSDNSCVSAMGARKWFERGDTIVRRRGEGNRLTYRHG